MPNISYDQSSPTSFASSSTPASAPKAKGRLSLPKLSLSSMGHTLFALLKLAAAIAVTALIATFGVGVLSAVSTNITLSGLSVEFDPLLTLTYLILAYLLSFYFRLNQSQGFRYFIVALFLSYTTPFVQGSLFLVLILPILKLFRLLQHN